MTKIDTLRRFILPCFAPPSAALPTAAPAASAKKRISTSLRDDVYDHPKIQEPNLELDRLRKGSDHVEDDRSEGDATGLASPVAVAPPRPSRTMVIGTIFGPRRSHVWFCVQHDRLSTKPSLLLEFSIPTQQLVKEMQSSELVRIALECSADSEPGLGSCPLRSVPMWTLSCNGRKLGFATKRKASEQNRLMLKTMQSMTVGAGVIPSGTGSASSEEIMYMRANYEHVIGSANSESFHLINPDDCPGASPGTSPGLTMEKLHYTYETGSKQIFIEMLEGLAVLHESDMAEAMRSNVMDLAYQALDLHESSDFQVIACQIKQKFDEAYGPSWHCVIGKDYGSCITHLCGCFMFFHIDTMGFLIFKDGEDFTKSNEEDVGVLQRSKSSS